MRYRLRVRGSHGRTLGRSYAASEVDKRQGHYWSNYRSGQTISHFYVSKRLSTGKLLQPQSTDKSDAAYGYNVRCQRE